MFVYEISSTLRHKSPPPRLKDTALRSALRDAEQLLDVAERDADDARRALTALKRGKTMDDKGGHGRQSRSRAQALLQRVERNAREKRKLLSRLRSQFARADASLVEFRAGMKPGPQSIPPLNGAQLRAARSLLEFSQKQMAAQLGVSTTRLRTLEKHGLNAGENPALLAALVRNRAALGIELIPAGIYVGSGGPGLRLKRRRARAGQDVLPKKKQAAARARRKKALAA